MQLTFLFSSRWCSISRKYRNLEYVFSFWKWGMLINKLDLQSHSVSNVQNSVYFVWVCVVHYKQDVKVSITYMAQYVRTWKYKLRYLQCHFNRHVMDSFNFVWVALINRKKDMEIPITNMSHHWTCSNQKEIQQHHEAYVFHLRGIHILHFISSNVW